jgi:hypothetical protein
MYERCGPLRFRLFGYERRMVEIVVPRLITALFHSHYLRMRAGGEEPESEQKVNTHGDTVATYQCVKAGVSGNIPSVNQEESAGWLSC